MFVKAKNGSVIDNLEPINDKKLKDHNISERQVLAFQNMH